MGQAVSAIVCHTTRKKRKRNQIPTSHHTQQPVRYAKESFKTYSRKPRRISIDVGKNFLNKNKKYKS